MTIRIGCAAKGFAAEKTNAFNASRVDSAGISRRQHYPHFLSNKPSA
jgi:hypothetical protein